MKFLLLPAVWAGLRARSPADHALLRGGSAVASGDAVSSIPCQTLGCHSDNSAYRARQAHHGWHNAEPNATVDATTPTAAPEALSAEENVTDHAVIANSRLFAGSPCTDATNAHYLTQSTKMELMTNNSAIADEVAALQQANDQARAKLGMLQAAEVRANTTNNQTSAWCQSRQAQLEAQDAWFEAHLTAIKNRCDRAEGMSSDEFKQQFQAVLDKFKTEAAAALELQKKQAEEQAAAEEAERQRQHKAQYGPGLLMTNRDGKCMDYNYNDQNIYMHDCHSEDNQIFFVDIGTSTLRTRHSPSKCVDYNFNDGNVYMHDCHGGSNQQWYLDVGSGALKTRHDSKCLDYNYNNGNIYMHDCHHETNQQWYFA